MSARTPADIAADLRPDATDGHISEEASVLHALAGEVEALPVLTADEIADLRAVWQTLAGFRLSYDRLTAVLDRIDPPTVEKVEPDPWALLAAVADTVDFTGRKFFAAIDAARAALAERGAS